MDPIALAFLLFAAPAAGSTGALETRPVAVRTSVEILSAEEIRFDRGGHEKRESKRVRQTRQRDGAPMVEFY